MNNEKKYRQYGYRLAQARTKAGLMQKDVAKHLGVKDNVISYFENGDRLPSVEQYKELSKLFNVSADYLLGLATDFTTDDKLKFVCKYTGLSAEAIEKIREYCIPFFAYRNELTRIKEENNQEYQDYETVRTEKEKKNINSIISSSVFDEMISALNSIENINDLFVSNLAIYFGDFKYFEKLQFDEPLLLTLKEIVADNSKTVNLEDEKNLIIYRLQKSVSKYFEKLSNLPEIENKNMDLALSQMQYINTLAVNKACKKDNINIIQEHINQEFRSRFAFDLTKNSFDKLKTIYEELKKGGINGNDN